MYMSIKLFRNKRLLHIVVYHRTHLAERPEGRLCRRGQQPVSYTHLKAGLGAKIEKANKDLAEVKYDFKCN